MSEKDVMIWEKEGKKKDDDEGGTAAREMENNELEKRKWRMK